MRDVLRRYKPECIEDLTALNALYRPGPIQGGMIDDFIERKWGRRKVEYTLPQLEPLLKETLGVIVYQEQVMQIANRIASYSLGESDLLRRAMGKKDPAEMAKQRDRFMEGAAGLGLPKAPAGEIFDQMEKFAGYGFNKSHSAAYALLSYQTAYLKTHYPVEFMAALLTSEISKPENVVKYIQECREMEIAVAPPDVRLSDAHFTPKGDVIRFGLTAIKNVGGNAIESILAVRRELEEKGSGFTNFWEFCEKVDLRLLNKRVLESLIKAGAFDSMGTRAQLSAAVDKAIERGQKAQKDAAQGQHGLFGLFNESPINGSSADDLPYVPDWEEKDRLSAEKEVLGFFVSGHPLDRYAEKLRNLSNVKSVAEALEMKPPPPPRWGQQRDPSDELSIAGVLVGMRAAKSKRNDKMYAAGHLEDASGKIEVICFAKDYDRIGDQLKTEAAVLLRGNLIGEEESAPKLAISGLQHLDDVQIKLPTGIRLRLNLDIASEELFNTMKARIDAAPGPGKVMMHLQKKGHYEVVLEPDKMSVAADRAWVESMEELLGRGAVQVLS
jgi:DNA polymerase-3 subunit alpha